MFRGFHLKHCKQRSICAHSVILSISSDHTSVQTTLSCLSCRYDLQLCGKKIFLFHIILLFKDIQYILFYCLFLLIIFQVFQWSAADQDVQILSLDHFCRFFLHLLSCKMDQKICNIYDGIIFILTDIYFCCTSVFFYHYAMDCQGKSHPLVFLNTAIIMGIQICKIRILI